MKIIFLTNNPKVATPLFNWLNKQGEDALLFQDPLTPEYILDNKPDIVISYNYKHIIAQSTIDLMPGKIINLHISLLPWNKGAHPNIWSFLENTPKGVTIHLVDQGLDTGDILLQQKLDFDETIESLSSSYAKLHSAIQQLFRRHWQEIKLSSITPIKQRGKGSGHTSLELQPILYRLSDTIWKMPISQIKQQI